jgi:hypothetical protein
MVENKDNVPVNETETKVEETTEVVGTSSESTVNEKKKARRSLILTWVENIVEALIIVVAVVFSAFAIANPGGMNEDYSKINVNMLPVLSNSMSGTFENLNVPHTLVSFAVNTEDVNNVTSGSFKKAGIDTCSIIMISAGMHVCSTARWRTTAMTGGGTPSRRRMW